jgi:hypothetical protein
MAQVIDVTVRLHPDTNKVEIIGTTNDDLDLATTHPTKSLLLGTGFLVKSNPKRPDTIAGGLRWLETAMRKHPSMSQRDQNAVDMIMERFGGIATYRYWY